MSPQANNELILIIEDESGIANALQTTLKGVGFQTCELSSSSGLFEALERDIRAVVLDISLGDSDAVEVIRHLARAGFSGPIQLISGSAQALLDDVRRVGERHGLAMLPVLRKPFRMREITGALLDRCEPGRGRATASPISRQAHPSRRVDLATSLGRQQVEVWYQPKLDLRTGTITGAECLARVRDPEFGLMLPGSFLPSADTRTLAALTEFVSAATASVDIAIYDFRLSDELGAAAVVVTAVGPH